MPNHCYNRVTICSSGDNEASSLDQIETLKDIFEGESVFPQIIPEPDWANMPLMSEDVQEYSFSEPRGKVGELPVYKDGTFGKQLRFPSTDVVDNRWYDWRLRNWDTKWDAYDVEILDEDEENLEIGFNTAWSPPEAICNKIREDYPDVSVSWFYDEPGAEVAGYL